MTQHALPKHTAEDQIMMRRLGLIIGSFIAATALLALTIGFTMG